jgi:hypothetical protein
MKWIRTITGVVENVVSMFRQVDTLIQRIQSRQYIAKVIYQNGLYKVTVVDREGNAVDGAIVLVYLSEPGVITVTQGSISATANELSGYQQWQNILWIEGAWRSFILRIPDQGIKLFVVNNPRATIKACVLGVEQGI